ncbi:MAG: CvpA family protein [Emergencia sp.]|nr:CvpA family protein [Emergencia sp.]
METGTGFIMDIIVLAIILFSTIFGARKGFAAAVSSFMQWFLCIALGFFFNDTVKEILRDYTELDESIHRVISEQLSARIEESPTYRTLPDLFGDFLKDSPESFGNAAAEPICSALMSVIAFLAVVFGIKVLCALIMFLFSRKHNDGVTGFIDGFLGFLFGMARGLLLALLGFAVLVPVLGLLLPESAQPLIYAIEHSDIASVFYNENVLLILVRDLFS